MSSSGDIVDGSCSDFNTELLLNVGTALIAGALVAGCRVAFAQVPSGSSPSWGRPYTIGAFLFSIVLWNTLPQAATFLLFHWLTEKVFVLQSNAACILLAGLPIIAWYLLLLGMMLVFVYSADDMKATLSKVLLTIPTVAGANVLVCGVTGRGMVFVDALEKEHSGASKSKTVVVDYAHRWKAFVAHNIAACGITSVKLEDCFFESVMTSDGNEFGLPFPDNTFDRIVIPPFLRNANPIGEFTVGEEVKQRRMQKLLREALRVLKQGGEFVCVDQAANATAIWADLRDAGVTSFIEYSGAQLGPNVFFRTKCVKVHAANVDRARAIIDSGSSNVDVSGSIQSENLYESEEHPKNAKSTPLVTGGGRPVSSTMSSDDFRILCAFQLVVTVLLVYLSFAGYSLLNFPKSIPLSQRVNNMIINVAVSYPAIAYFTRATYVDAESQPSSTSHLFRMMLKSESIAVVVSLVLNIVLGVPTLLLQILLASTSLSSDTRSYIGLGISIFIGLMSYKRGRRQAAESGIAKRKIPAEYADYLRG